MSHVCLYVCACERNTRFVSSPNRARNEKRDFWRASFHETISSFSHRDDCPRQKKETLSLNRRLRFEKICEKVSVGREAK
jgi:hypothetical protein